MLPIGILEECDLFRIGIKLILEYTNEYKIIIESSNRLEFLIELDNSAEKPSVVLIDIHSPGMDTNDTLKTIRIKYPGIKIILLSKYTHDHIIINSLKKGVNGFISKSCGHKLFFSALERVIANELIILMNGDETLTDYNSRFLDKQTPDISLKQRDFLKLCAHPEKSYKMIADELELSPKTVDRYRDILFKKLKVTSRVGLAIYAIQTGITNL